MAAVAAVAVAGALLLVAVAILLRTDVVARRIASGLATATASSSDCTVSIGRLALRPPVVTAENIALQCEDDTVTAPRVRVRLAIPALLRGDIRVTSLEVDEPVARLHADGPLARLGGGPATSRSKPALRVDSVTLTDARWEIDGLARDGRIAIARSRFSALLVPAMRGTFEAQGVDASMAGRALHLPELSLRLTADAASLHLTDLRVTARDVGSFAGGIERRAPPGETATWHGTIQGEASAAGLMAVLAPDHATSLEGAARVRATWSGAAMPSLEIASPALVASGWREGLPPLRLEALAARLAPSADGVELTELRARACGGSLQATGRLGGANGQRIVALVIDARDLDARLLPLPAAATEFASRLACTIDVGAQIAVPVENPGRARGGMDVTLRAQAAPAGNEIPLAGTLAVELADGALHVRQADLTSGALAATGSGTVGFDGVLALTARVRGPVAEFARSLAGARLSRANPRGVLAAELTLRGPAASPDIEATGRIAGLTLADLRAGDVSGRARRVPDGWLLEDIVVAGPTGGATGSVLLRPDGLAGTWTVTDADLAEIARAARMTTPLGGLVSGSGTIGGTFGAIELTATLASERATYGEQVLHDVSLAGSYSGDLLVVDEASARAGQGTLRAHGSMPVTQGDGDLEILASKLDLASLLPDLGIEGSLSGSMRVAGSLAAPRLPDPALIQARAVRLRGAGPADLFGTLGIEDGSLVLRAASSQHPGARGTASLQLDAPRRFALDLALPAITLPIPRDEDPGEVTVSSLRLAAEGTLDDLEHARWSASLAQACVRHVGWTLNALEPVELIGLGRDVTLSAVRVRQGGLELEMDGNAHLASPLRWQLRARSRSRTEGWRGPSWQVELAGDVDARVVVDGEGTDVRVDGLLRLTRGEMRSDGFPHVFEDLEGEVLFDGKRFVLRRARAFLGGGPATADAEFELGGPFRVHLRGSGVALAVPEALRLRSLSDLDLTWAGDWGGSVISGKLDVLQATLAKDLNLAAALLRRGAPAAMREPSGALARIGLDVAVRAPEGGVWVDNDIARAEMRADLRMRGTLARPVVDGSITSVDGGRLFFQGVRYRLEAASLDFSPARPNDPDLRVDATTQIGAHVVSLSISGRATAPRIDLASDPELPRERIAALLLTRGMVGGTSGTAEQAISAAADDVGVESLGGLDLLQVDPAFLEGQGDRAARITVGQRFGRRFFAAHSTDLGGKEESSTEVRWLAAKWLVRAAHEATGRTVGEIRWLKRFGIGRNKATADETPRCVSVTLDGVPEDRRTDVAKALALQPGSRADARALSLASRRARQELATTHPLARLRCASEPAREPGTLDVTCTARPAERVALTIEDGSGTLTRKQRERLRALAWRDLSDFGRSRDADEQVQESIVARLRLQGYWYAETTVTREDDPDAMALHAVMDPGPRVHVQQVRLEGAGDMTETLLETMDSPGRGLKRRPGLSPELLHRDAEALLGSLQDAGYLDASVEPARVSFPDAREAAAVEFTITRGEQVRLERAEILGMPGDPPAAARELISDLVPGVARPAQLDDIAGLLLDALDQQGHSSGTVTWRIEREGEGRVIFDVEPGPRIAVGAVRVAGERRTRPSVVRRATGLKPGDDLSHAALARAQRDVLRLGPFGSVVVRDEEPGDASATVRDVLVQVRERDNFEISAGAGWVGEEGPRVAFSVADRNIGGKALSLGLSLQAGAAEDQAEVVAGWKNAWGSRLDLVASAGVRDERRESFVSRRQQLAIQLSRALTPRTTIQGRYRIESFRLDDLELTDADESGVVAGVGFAVAHDTRDDALLPRRGSFTSADFEINSRALGSSASFTQLVVKHARVIPIRSNLSWVASIRAGAAMPFDGDDVPASERFFVGGSSSVRGFRTDAIGPRDPVTGKPAGGEAFLVLSNEFRFRMGRYVSAFAFVDAGNAWSDASDLGGTSLRVGAGPGVLISTPAGPLRLAYGFNLDPEPGEPSGRIHFLFGPGF